MQKTLFGKTRDGQDIHKITLENGDYTFSVLTWGATLFRYGTKDVNIVLSHESAEQYFDDSTYMGEVVGPVANRIAKAKFSLDGNTYHLEKNNGVNTLHSASACYGQKLWSLMGVGTSSVTLCLSTPDGLGGFPGGHEITVTYTLESDGSLIIQYRTRSDKKCPVAVTNHAYFNLSASSDIRDTILTIPAERYVAVDDELIPTGVLSVENTDFDFRKGMRIGARRSGCYDNTFVLDQNAIIKAEGDRAYLMCKTTEPGVQLYTGEFIVGDHKPFEGFCLETGRYPDTPNHDDYPKAYTSSDEEYVSITVYKMGVK